MSRGSLEGSTSAALEEGQLADSDVSAKAEKKRKKKFYEAAKKVCWINISELASSSTLCR